MEDGTNPDGLLISLIGLSISCRLGSNAINQANSQGKSRQYFTANLHPFLTTEMENSSMQAMLLNQLPMSTLPRYTYVYMDK